MDSSFYIDQTSEDSRHYRSRANSHLSSTATQFQGLHIQATPPPSEHGATASDILSSSPQSFLKPDPQPRSSVVISSPAPQQLTPFPLLSKGDLDAEWSYITSTEDSPGSAPLLHLQPAPFLGVESADHKSSASSTRHPADMSAIGIQQYDARFDAGARTYTWPQFEMHEQFLSHHDLSPGLSPGTLSPYDEIKPSPIYARSLSSSPPRAGLTPEQRELKRQRDHARRNSKSRIRRERSPSNSYSVSSQKTTPDLLPRTLPDYSNSLAPTPLLSQTPDSISHPSYLSQYSPHGQVSEPEMYGPVFTMGPNDFAPITAYTVPYSGAETTLPSSYIHRQHSLSSASDQSILYKSEMDGRDGLY
ncbi:hypothetical protein B7494_g6843 [Chlorociboria aeruginascens]|nr:hypothetical protein B7494_g6843 [Chlorociboria aeruginascens]